MGKEEAARGAMGMTTALTYRVTTELSEVASRTRPKKEIHKAYGETEGHGPRSWVSQRAPSAIFDLGFEDTYYMQVPLLKVKPIHDEERFKPLWQRPTHLGTTPYQPEFGIYGQMLMV